MVPLEEGYEALRPENVAMKERRLLADLHVPVEETASFLGLGFSSLSYRDYGQAQSGTHSEATAGRVRTVLSTVLAPFTGRDRLDVLSLSGAEYAARRVVTLGKTVAVNPKSPGLHGLLRLIERSLSEGGGAATRDFTAPLP